MRFVPRGQDSLPRPLQKWTPSVVHYKNGLVALSTTKRGVGQIEEVLAPAGVSEDRVYDIVPHRLIEVMEH